MTEKLLTGTLSLNKTNQPISKRTKLTTIYLNYFHFPDFPDNIRYIQSIHNESQYAPNLPIRLARIDSSAKIFQPGYDTSRAV